MHKLEEYKPEGYHNENFVSNEYRENLLGRILSGYDEKTWQRLAEHRKKTYRRAAATLFYDFDEIERVVRSLDPQRRSA